MKSDSNDVKQLVGQVIELVSRVANQCSDSGLEEASVKLWVPALINGTKEKNTTVRSYSESALIMMLQLRKSEDLAKVCLSSHHLHHDYSHVTLSPTHSVTLSPSSKHSATLVPSSTHSATLAPLSTHAAV